MINSQRGFTLLEVMLAIAIFSAISFLSVMVFSQASEQYHRAQKLANDFHALQYTMLLLENDLMQYVPRKNRQTRQTFASRADEMIFTTQTRDAATPFEDGFVLTTVHWYVQDGTLYRAAWDSPDGQGDGSARLHAQSQTWKRDFPDGQGDRPTRELLANITHLTSLLVPAEGNSASSTIAITLEQENKEIIRRLFILPGWTPERQESEDKK